MVIDVEEGECFVLVCAIKYNAVFQHAGEGIQDHQVLVGTQDHPVHVVGADIPDHLVPIVVDIRESHVALTQGAYV